jgi:hypothetical protein
MKAVISTLTLIAATAVAQERCDAEDPIVYCNTTEILAYQSSDCKPYHLFIVRGSDEPYPGRQGNISSQLCASLGNDQCGFESIEYPAKSTAWGKEEWCKSAGKGASDGQAQVKAYSKADLLRRTFWVVEVDIHSSATKRPIQPSTLRLATDVSLSPSC